MVGKTRDEIFQVIELAIKEVKDIFQEDICLIDSFVEITPKDIPKESIPLWYLGQSITLMAKADIVYFAKGWRNARGCIIENTCACEYGLLTIETN